MQESNETLEKDEPLQKPKRERTPAQQQATQKMLMKRKEAVDAKRELVVPLVQQIETIKKTKGKDVVKPVEKVEPKPKLKPVVESKLPLVEESEDEEEEDIVIKKKPKVAKKKKVIYLEADSESEEEQPVFTKPPVTRMKVIDSKGVDSLIKQNLSSTNSCFLKPEIIKATLPSVKPVNPYTIRFV